MAVGRKLTVAAVACALLGSMNVGMAQAGSGSLHACVRKKTGKTRLLSGPKAASKKCPRGWKKVTWNTPGPTGPGGAAGPQGAQGPRYTVRDGRGAVVGEFVSYVGLWAVQQGDAIYAYDSGGVLLEDNYWVRFLAADCSGQAWFPRYSDTRQETLDSVGGPRREVLRSPGRPNRAFKLASGFTVVDVPSIYAVYPHTGACVDVGPYSGDLFVLDEVPAPQDVPGPLTLGA